jgi:hypothetical protein
MTNQLPSVQSLGRRAVTEANIQKFTVETESSQQWNQSISLVKSRR